MNKAALERLGQLPLSLAVTEEAVYIWGVEADEEEEQQEENGNNKA